MEAIQYKSTDAENLKKKIILIFFRASHFENWEESVMPVKLQALWIEISSAKKTAINLAQICS